MKNRIEDYFIDNGIISSSQLNWAKLKAGSSNEPLYRILIKEGLISEKNYFSILSQVYEKEFINLDASELNSDLIRSIPVEIIQRYYFIPVEKSLDGIKIATYEPNNFFMIQEIEELTGYKIEVCVSTPSDIIRARREFDLEVDDNLEEDTLESLSLDKVAQAVNQGYSSSFEEKTDLEDYDIHNTDAPVVVLVNKLILDAVKQGATDIHIEAFEDYLKVRYRIDGMLKKIMEIEKSAQEAVITRLKIMADLDITERFVPQDGRFKLRISDDDIDFRITFLPSMFGQNISIRIFNKKVTPLTFDEIGLSDKQIELVKNMLTRKFGLVLIVGPTGSGKTTTLYTILNYINREDLKIVTIEDPVEYRLDGIHQIPVRLNKEDEAKSMTFARGLKAILRQDPNVIMIGEIRDSETAEIAINAALTGHLVFSTLHANTTVDVVSRLKHLGIHSELVSDALNMVIAQRLCRKLCPNCSSNEKKGCEFCKYTGFSGRIGIFEILNVTQEIREIIASDMAGVFIRKQAEQENYWKSLEEDALEKNQKGIISKEEYNSLIIY